MLPVNAVGERLEGKPHEPFDGGELETGRPMEKGCAPTRDRWPPWTLMVRHRASSLPYTACTVRRVGAGNETWFRTNGLGGHCFTGDGEHTFRRTDLSERSGGRRQRGSWSLGLRWVKKGLRSVTIKIEEREGRSVAIVRGVWSDSDRRFLLSHKISALELNSAVELVRGPTRDAPAVASSAGEKEMDQAVPAPRSTRHRPGRRSWLG